MVEEVEDVVVITISLEIMVYSQVVVVVQRVEI
jgi:hypothetical protein